jgi:hypothetical protein
MGIIVGGTTIPSQNTPQQKLLDPGCIARACILPPPPSTHTALEETGFGYGHPSLLESQQVSQSLDLTSHASVMCYHLHGLHPPLRYMARASYSSMFSVMINISPNPCKRLLARSSCLPFLQPWQAHTPKKPYQITSTEFVPGTSFMGYLGI